MYGRPSRTIRIDMPFELIPMYDLLSETCNSILNNPTFMFQLEKIDYFGDRGKVRNEIHKILKPYVYSKINSLPVKSWYARTIYEYLRRLFKSYYNNLACYNAVANVKKITDKIVKDLRDKGYVVKINNLRQLKKAGKPPQMPKHCRFVLDLSISDKTNCVRNIKDNTKVTIRYAKNKTLELDYILPKNIRDNFDGRVSKPLFYKDEHGDYLGAVAYEIKPKPVKRIPDRILGVDLGQLKTYSAVVLFENGSTSQEYIPSGRLDNLCEKVELLKLENRRFKKKNDKVDPYITLNAWQETLIKYENRLNNRDNNRQKIVNIKDQIAWQAANEIVLVALQNNCSEIHLDYLKWLGSKGGKWNFAAVQERVVLIAELYGIKVWRVNTAHSSATHPITGEKGEYVTIKESCRHKPRKHKEKSTITRRRRRVQASKRKAKFSNGEIIDRDQLAATNHASRGKIQHEVKKINQRSSKRVRPVSRKAEIRVRVEEIKKTHSLKGTEIIVTDSALERATTSTQRADSYNNVLIIIGKAKHSLSPGHIFIPLIKRGKNATV